MRIRRVRVVSEPLSEYLRWEHACTDVNIELDAHYNCKVPAREGCERMAALFLSPEAARFRSHPVTALQCGCAITALWVAATSGQMSVSVCGWLAWLLVSLKRNLAPRQAWTGR